MNAKRNLNHKSSNTKIKKQRQIRIQISGGSSDVKAVTDEIKTTMSSTMNNARWELIFEENKGYGNAGPLKKTLLGFIQKDYLM